VFGGAKGGGKRSGVEQKTFFNGKGTQGGKSWTERENKRPFCHTAQMENEGLVKSQGGEVEGDRRKRGGGQAKGSAFVEAGRMVKER